MSDRLERIRMMQEQQEETDNTEQFIVAEISKNWPEEPLPGVRQYLAERFEDVINNNYKRGYRLVDWRLSRLMSEHQHHINETIIAVFERFERRVKS